MTGVRHGIVAVSRSQCLSLELYPALAQFKASLDQLPISLANQCNVNLMLPPTLLECHGTRLVLCIPRQVDLQPHEDIEQSAMRVAVSLLRTCCGRGLPCTAPSDSISA